MVMSERRASTMRRRRKRRRRHEKLLKEERQSKRKEGLEWEEGRVGIEGRKEEIHTDTLTCIVI